jgi:hypothetical protein
MPTAKEAEARMAFFIDPDQFLLFFRDPDGAFTTARMKEVLARWDFTVEGEAEPFAVRWFGEGPVFYASIIRGMVAPILAGRLLGRRRRKHRALAESCDAYIKIKFESLDEVLEAAGTLVALKEALQTTTDGLVYYSWNQMFIGPEG